VTIDFSGFTPGPQANDFLSSQGIASVDVLRDGVFVEAPTLFPEANNSPGNGSFNIGNGNFLGQGNNPNTGANRVMTLTLTREAVSFSFRRVDVFNGSVYPTWSVIALDAVGASIAGTSFGEGSGPFIADTNSATFMLFGTPTQNIKSVVFSSIPSSGTFGTAPIDDITFAVVPEPSSTALLAVGLLAISYHRRKQV
jgi:hypothetical protein